jgi:hypothetical protein
VGTSDRRVVRLIRLFGGGAATMTAFAEDVRRLAERYRVHLGQSGRADALLDRMLVKYPKSRELQVARRHS